jgi:RNA polymerase sigma factor (sigma-70 family)
VLTNQRKRNILSNNVLHNAEALYERVAAGDEWAFRDLFDLYVPRLQGVIYRITKSATVTDDLVQETMLKVWVARDRLAALSKPDSWIIKIGFFLALNHVKRLAIHSKAMEHIGYQQFHDFPGNPAGEATEFRQMIRLVGEAVRQLPEKQQLAYQLSREQGLSIAEIAQQMGLAVSTVKNLLVMALKHIRLYLEKAGYSSLLLLFFPFL